MKKTKKILFLALAFVLVAAISVGATLAWLWDSTAAVKNTFTVGKVDIELTETLPEGQEAKMIPGNDIEKNPTVSVAEDSEDCWLFVKVEVSEAAAAALDYEIADGWHELDGVANVYYREASAGDSFSILANDMVSVRNSIDDSAADEEVSMTFTAYAIQSANLGTAAAAWAAGDFE